MDAGAAAKWWDGRAIRTAPLQFINEEPLAVRVQGQPYAVLMRTPGEDIALAAGFCFTEGLVDDPSDMVQLACCDAAEANTVTMTLTPQRREAVAPCLDRRGYISQTSCGICGKALLEDLQQQLEPLTDAVRVPLPGIQRCLEQLDDLQPLRRQTAATHAAAIFDADFHLLTVAEDVGRHNALDKAIGRLFLDGLLGRAKIAALSSRISYELVQKTARARVPVLAAVSRPTRLAVNLADQLNISLVGYARPKGLFIYSHAHRLSE
jgi:FdhD protein